MGVLLKNKGEVLPPPLLKINLLLVEKLTHCG